MLLNLLLVILCVLLFVEWFFNRRLRSRLVNKIPGETGVFIFGNTLEFIGLTPEEIFKRLRQYASQYKGFYRQWMYPFAVFHVYNPEDIEKILTSNTLIKKSVVYAFLRPWLRDGLLLSTGEKWRARRKILTPAFHFSILRYFTTILEDNSKKLVDEISSANEQTTMDVVPLMSNHTLNSICETSMGTKLDEISSAESHKYKNAIHKLGKLFVYRSARTIWFMLDSVFNATKSGRIQKEVLKIVHSFPKQAIKERRLIIQGDGFVIPTDDKDNTDVGVKSNKMALLDLLLDAESKGLIDENGIQEEVDTFMFEGHDTTAVALTYALLELANNKEIQEKVYEEQKEVFGDLTRPATMNELSQLKYLECFIKETLRLYPPVPIASRHIPEEFEISGYKVPKGQTEVHMHIFDLHRNPDLYAEPLAFKPERFYPENCINRHPYAYVPFSAGPRNCIGQKFAMLGMKSTLVRVVRSFRLLPVTRRDRLEFTMDLVLRTTHPIKVQFVQRT